MLHVYTSPLSFPANKVRFCVSAMGLEHEHHLVNVREGENKTEEYLAINPIGKVPAIDDDGFCLFESNAIVRYLARKHGKLYAETLQDQAIVDQWLDFVTSHVGLGFSKVLFNMKFAPMMGKEPDKLSLKEGRAFINRYLGDVDKRLSESRYLASNELTIADIGLLATTDPSEMIEIDLSGWPNLVAWRDALRAEAFYTSVHARFGEGILD